MKRRSAARIGVNSRDPDPRQAESRETLSPQWSCAPRQPNPGLHDGETYYREVLIPYRQGILKNNLEAGLDICLLGALLDDLAPGQWLTKHHDDVVWDAIAACHVRDNPFSLLGALDIALYRQTDARFAEFAAEAVRSLANEKCGDRDDLDSCALFCVLVKFVANRINLLENGARYPGHWKRMCAWIQAGVVLRALSRSSVSIDSSSLEQWTHGNMTAAGHWTRAFFMTLWRPWSRNDGRSCGIRWG